MKKKERTIKIYSIEEGGEVLSICKLDGMRQFALDHYWDMKDYQGVEDFPHSVESIESDEDVMVEFIEFWGGEVSVVAEVSEKEFQN